MGNTHSNAYSSFQRRRKPLVTNSVKDKVVNLDVYLQKRQLLASDKDCPTEQFVESLDTDIKPVQIHSANTNMHSSDFGTRHGEEVLHMTEAVSEQTSIQDTPCSCTDNSFPVQENMHTTKTSTLNDWCSCIHTMQLSNNFGNSINTESDCTRLNPTFIWHKPKTSHYPMAICLRQESQMHIKESGTSERCIRFLSLALTVRLRMFLKIESFDMEACCGEDSQDVSILIFFLEQNMSLIFCENGGRVHLVGIKVNNQGQSFPDNVELVPFQRSITGRQCEERRPNSNRIILHEIGKELIDPDMQVPDVDIQKLCKSAIRILLSQSRMGLLKIWIPDFINRKLHRCNDNEYQYVKTCSRKDKGRATDDSKKDEDEITDETIERQMKTYARIADTPTCTKLYSNSEQIDTPAVANCDTRTKPCSHTVQADNHAPPSFDHSLAEQRTTEIPSFDPYVTATRSMVSLSKPQKPHSDQQNDTSDHIQILRELTWLSQEELPVPQIDITVANVLDPIFRDMSSGTTPGPRITMKYELLRLCTLRNYPKTNKPYIIRLAGAGFYYAADGDEVICYCCGIRRRNWTEECKPMEIHRRLSPNCSFLMKNADVNIPVPPASTEEMTRFALLKELLKDEESSDSNLVNDSVMSARHTGNQQQGNSGNAHQPTTTSQGQNPNSPAIEVPQQPKHPHYGVLNTRVGSFLGFPDGNGQDPAVLADAGFYYVGFEDCVRCFQCGVGLRHWAPEDDPWIEHCRWTLATPCPYLVKKKGEEFVSLVRMAIEITQNEPNSQSLQEDTAPQNEGSVQATESSDNNNAERVEITPSVNRPGSRHGDQRQGSRPSDRNGNASKREPAPTADRAGDKRPDTKTGTKANGQSPAAKSGTNVRKPQSDIKKDTSKTSPTKDAKGKESLSDEQRRLIAENTRLRDQTICRVCCQREVCIVFLPCGHLVSCEICAPFIRTCPICSSKVKGTVKTFMS